MAETPNVCHSLHMPLQSGSDDVLRAMRRSYRSERYLGIIDKVRAAMPDAAITTDIIVGFPGETEADFARTLDVVRRGRGSPRAFTFQYSKRPGTPAATMDDQLPKQVVQERYERLIACSRGDHLGGEPALVGETVEVLVAVGEGRKDERTGRLSGRARDGRLVHFAAGELAGQIRPGDIVHTASRTRRRTTSTPTARRWPTVVPGPGTPPRRAAPRVRRVSCSGCPRSARRPRRPPGAGRALRRADPAARSCKGSRLHPSERAFLYRCVSGAPRLPAQQAAPLSFHRGRCGGGAVGGEADVTDAPAASDGAQARRGGGDGGSGLGDGGVPATGQRHPGRPGPGHRPRVDRRRCRCSSRSAPPGSRPARR